MLPILVPDGFHIIAHRGASAYAPENTAGAFKLAHEMGIKEVELDAQLTTDGEVALCHDTALTRYGHGPLIVEEMEWADLSVLDMGSFLSPYLFSGVTMMRLDDLFQAYGDRFIYHVELKGVSAELAAAVQQCIARYRLEDNCFITSFNYDALADMRAIDERVRMGWLIHEIDETAIQGARELGLYQLCPQAALVDARQVAYARQAVSEVRAWGVNGDAGEVPKLVQRVLDAGCDGMTINWPDWVAV